MSIDDEFGSSHDIENRRRRRIVEFDDDCFSDDPTSFSNEERDHSQERSGVHNYDGCSDEPPVKEYWRRRAFGTDNPQTDKITDKPDEELPKYRRACYQC